MGYKFNPFTGTLDEVGAGGGGGSTSPGGSTTQVQFNNAGAFGGDADLTWNASTNVLGVTGDVNLSDGGTYTTTLQTITPTAARTISLPDATGTVALVAGSSGQILWNNAGVNAGASTLTYDGSILTTSGRFINSYNAAGIASAPAKSFTGTWYTGGSATTTKPHLLIEPTGATSTAWSTSGTGLGVNALSGFGGNLLDLQVNGSSVFAVTGPGDVVVRSISATIAPKIYFENSNSTGLASISSTGGIVYIASDNGVDVGILTATNVIAQHRLTGTAPATATSTGIAGDVRYDASYIYICTATNTWKRALLTTW
jgi:hypothetical protein